MERVEFGDFGEKGPDVEFGDFGEDCPDVVNFVLKEGGEELVISYSCS